MATTEPQKWTATLGSTADVNALPATTPSGSGRASTSGLFPPVTQLPLDQGGIAPERGDFNALFKYLGEYIYYAMQGGVYTYVTTYDYTAGNFVLHGGSLYLCIAANGPGSAVKYPTDTAYWRQLALTSQLPTVNNGTLTIKQSGVNVATFTANQAGNSTANITVGNGTITVKASGTPVGSFTVNQSGNSTISIPEATVSSFGVVKTDQHGFDAGSLQGWTRLRSGIQIVWGAGSDNSPITFLHAFNSPPAISATCTTISPGIACVFVRSSTGTTIRVWDSVNNTWATDGTFTYIAVGTWG